MVPRPYWINGELAIVRRPQGGDTLDGEMLGLRAAGFDIVVSMLRDFEAADLGLAREKDAAKRAGLRFVNFPIPDGGVPEDLTQFNELLMDLEQCLAHGHRIGVHCFGCIGRSSVVAASLLIRSGIPAGHAWHQVQTARGCPVPNTLEQLEWVNRHIRPKP